MKQTKAKTVGLKPPAAGTSNRPSVAGKHQKIEEPEQKGGDKEEFQQNLVEKMTNLMNFIQKHCDEDPTFKEDFKKLGIWIWIYKLK